MMTQPAMTLRPPNSAMSKPRAVYSIDQILGTQHRLNNNIGKVMFFIVFLFTCFDCSWNKEFLFAIFFISQLNCIVQRSR